MRFWDSSALVAILCREEGAGRAVRLLGEDPGMVVWWATRVECEAAVARRIREGRLPARSIPAVRRALDGIAENWYEVEPTPRVRERAVHLVRTHPLRTADGLQLAAAIEHREGDPRGFPFLSLDRRLAAAAAREGFEIVALR